MSSNAVNRFRQAAAMPLVAILRGLAPARAAGSVRALVEAGVRIVEIPLNGAGALRSIAEARRVAPAAVIVGAGTVLTREEARAAHDAGAELMVTPNLDPDVIDEGHRLGLAVMPGVMTPSEALVAHARGVAALKLFPAEIIGPDGLKALRCVLPKRAAAIYAVGGITPQSLRAWYDAGADGFGIGSALFKPDFSDPDIAARARAFVTAWQAIGGAGR